MTRPKLVLHDFQKQRKEKRNRILSTVILLAILVPFFAATMYAAAHLIKDSDKLTPKLGK